MRIGVAAIARETFDLPLAGQVFAGAMATLRSLDHEIVGPDRMLFSADQLDLALYGADRLDRLLVLQVTFADAGMVLRLAEALACPVVLWGFPEARWGGRPRLNSLCGINLAAHALGRLGAPYTYLYGEAGDRARLARTLDAKPLQVPPAIDVITVETTSGPAAERVLDALDQTSIGLIGEHPAGFETCRFDEAWLRQELGVKVDRIPLDLLFDVARAQSETAIAPVRERARASLAGIDEVDAEATDGTLRLYVSLKEIAADRSLSGLAVRCWPEMFTEMGCAACGAMGFLNADGITCACEADILGDVTNLILQELAGEPPWMVDLVDVVEDDNSAGLWHCGMAPLTMADPASTPRADLHANRRKPLLQAFTLKAGRITLARLSQARNTPQLVIASGEIVSRPPSYCGTSGVVQFDQPVGALLDRLMALGLEHHVSFAYGEHRPALRALAAKLHLPLVEL